ncbi:MAG: DUF2752 domain-containing protein [Eubacteriales bacterium]|nr:DUF2752 domain-containing protein [Eubacteriales bacterium]
MTKRGKIAAAALGAAAVFAAISFLWVLKAYPQVIYDLPFDCVWLTYTGHYCAGCGITRAVHHALNGQFYAAWRMNPFLSVVLPLGGVLLVWEGTRRLRGRPSIGLKPWMGWAFLVALVLFTVLRNLPMPPFCYLAPTAVG